MEKSRSGVRDGKIQIRDINIPDPRESEEFYVLWVKLK
jgi:hypothetical protein